VLLDLQCWRDARIAQAEILYWRTTTGEEVDFVLETGGRVLPIEVKATARPRLADAAKLRSFRAEYDKLSRAGLLLHTGTQLGVLAAPWWTVC
jgi:predicted AAA+ superfamily ATPase